MGFCFCYVGNSITNDNSVEKCKEQLFVKNNTKNLLDITIKGTFLFLISFGLFAILCFVNKKGIKTNKVHEYYLPIMERIKENLQ